MEKILKKNQTNSQKTRIMTRIAILTAIATILYKIEIPIMVAHLKLDPSLIPSLVGGLMMGPVVGVTIEFLKNVINLFSTSSAGIGEFINFIVGSSVLLPLCFIYRKKESNSSYILGSVIAFVSILAVGALCNYLLTPAYFKVLKLDPPTHDVIMGFVSASFALNSLKASVTIVPTFFMLNMIKRNKI